MNLRLVTTDTGRAIAIRDHILPLVRQDGTVEVQRDVVRLTELRIRDWVFRFWTPFNELGREEASSPWALLASGQITMRKVDGWQTLAEVPTLQCIDLAA